MKVLLLGTAAGGGFPQWNCACRMCAADLPARTQDCVAFSADGTGWYLINASPDIRAQILSTPELTAGPGPRDTPLRGALLTDAELDHTLGLTMLREGAGLRVWAPGAALQALRTDFPLQGIVSRYGAWQWQQAVGSFPVDGLTVTVFPISDKRPKYAQSTVDGPWVVAYKISDPAGGTLVYAPCLKSWPDGFDELTADATCVILDGTFYSPDEMSGATDAGVGSGAQRAMGHIPIAGPDGSLARIARRPGKRWIYTHLNNTNPILDPDSEQYKEVLAAGAEAPPDGTLIDV
ncbi:pyrroloquinoline quinone biosynthesis protein PqqB [Actinosynnema sp. ALI-1.44]|uniref:pyrroloquinoline quinone biosynthesis protein PqqB n=1 Tax=Actinosynnema sp. ALI-1.44 TaxID=1933779 RepID=UPI00097C75D4|nr:pyrroloquinoline quinone biosynthesis protein PqqB [Actinosynnema sp. ALI-1.44]ONI85310.1 pyrroloquinoline quinone biosynthesis protein PqqB [Actinosynnema sp. ALI-1.44]